MDLDFTRLNNLAFEPVQEETEWEELDVPKEPLPKIDNYSLISSGQGAERESDNVGAEIDEEGLFPLPAQRVKRMDARTLASMLRAFKESCRLNGISYSVKEDEQWRPRVVLSPLPDGAHGVGLCGMKLKLGQEPELEAALLIELSRKDQQLRDILEERAAIRAADGLSDDDMTVALLTIGVDPDNPIPSYDVGAGGLQRYLTPKPKSPDNEGQDQMREYCLGQRWGWDGEEELTA